MDSGCPLLVRGPFRSGQLAARCSAELRPTTAELDAHIERRWQAALDHARREQRPLFDGAVLRWVDYLLEAATPPHGERKLTLILGRSSYRDFVGTNLDPTIAPADRGGRWPWSHFGNAVGTSALVITRDQRLVAGRRSDRVLGYPGFVHSFGGIVEAADDPSGAVDLFASVHRELTEELGLLPSELEQSVLTGIIRAPRIEQPELLFAVRTPLTLGELRDRWSHAASRDEHSTLVDFADDASTIECALEAAAPVSPIGRACFALYFDVVGGGGATR